MKILMSRSLPGHLGGLNDETLEQGQAYEIADGVAATFLREGWAVIAPADDAEAAVAVTDEPDDERPARRRR